MYLNPCLCRSEDLELVLPDSFYSDIAISDHPTSKLIYCAVVMSCKGETIALLSL